MNIRYFRFDCPTNIQVSIAIKMGMYSTLKTDFSATSLPGFHRSVCNFIIRNQIRVASQIFLSFTYGESAEVTGILADIGVVNVSCDDVTDNIAVDFLSQSVGMVKYVMQTVSS